MQDESSCQQNAQSVSLQLALSSKSGVCYACHPGEHLIERQYSKSVSLDIGATSLQLPEDEHQCLTLFCPRCGYKHKVRVRCKDRLCPYCSKRAFKRIMARFRDVILDGTLSMKNPMLLTLTVKNMYDLEAQIKLLRKSFVEFRRQKWFHGEEFKDKELHDTFPGMVCEGGIYTIEIVDGEEGWHAHIHALIDAREFPQDYISYRWELLTGAPVVHYENAWDLEWGLFYILKYMLKPPKLEKHRADQYRQIVKGVRLVNAWGKYYKMVNSITKKQDQLCPNCGERLVIMELFDFDSWSGGHFDERG